MLVCTMVSTDRYLKGVYKLSLCITRLYRDYGPLEPAGVILDKQSDEMWAIDSALQGLRHWLEHREGGWGQQPGYFCRWGEDENFQTSEYFETHWKAEPSLDEYSGLLLGLRWATALGTPGISQAANNWLSHISIYLTETGGWLVTGGEFFVVRGPDILANAFPLRCILPQYSLQYPLRLGSRFNEYFHASYARLQRFKSLLAQHPEDSVCAEFVEKYGETLEPNRQVHDTKDDVDFWEKVVTIVATVVLGPVGLALGLAGIYYINKAIGKVENVTDEGSGTKKQDIVDSEGQSILKKKSLQW